MSIYRRFHFLALAAISLGVSSLASAELSPKDLEAFFDGFLPMQLKEHADAQAVVVVTQGARVIWARGYGSAKGFQAFEPSTPVGLGSLSSLATATALMQLVEEGKVELHRDINDYLDFKIHRTYAQPITLEHLLTHTAGFEQTLRSSVLAKSKALSSLREYLIDNQPQRIYPPGEVMAMSDYGLSLAGYILERVSGKRFESYLFDHLFTPLGMSRSSFEQCSECDKSIEEASYLEGEYFQAIPAKAMMSNALDMTRLMLAHLGHAQGPFLSAKTLELMHAPTFLADPRVMGMALGFFETTRNGHYILMHRGETRHVQSQLSLIPDAQVGFLIFIRGSSKSLGCLRSMLWKQFLNRYFSDPLTATAAAITAQEAIITGPYMSTQRSALSFLHARDVFNTHTLTCDKLGHLTFGALRDYDGKLKRWLPIAHGLYEDSQGRGHLLYRLDRAGTPTLFCDSGTFQACKFYESRQFCLGALIFSSVVFLSTILFWPLGIYWRRHGHRASQISLEAMPWRYFARLSCCYNLALMGLWFFMLRLVIDKPYWLSARLDSCFYLLELLSNLSFLSVLITLVNAYKSLNSRRSWLLKAHDLSMLIASLLVIGVMIIFSMMNVNVQY